MGKSLSAYSPRRTVGECVRFSVGECLRLSAGKCLRLSVFRFLNLAVICGLALFSTGCGGSGSNGDKPSILPLVPVEATVSASGERFGFGLPGEGSLNALSKADLQTIQAGTVATSVAAPRLGAYLPAGTPYPATSTLTAASYRSTSSPENSAALQGLPSLVQELLPVHLDGDFSFQRNSLRVSTVATMTPGIQTLIGSIDAVSGTTVPTVSWPGFVIPPGYVADDLRLVGLSAGTCTSSSSSPVPVCQIQDPYGNVAYSFSGREIASSGNLSARSFSPSSVPLSQLRLFPVSVSENLPWRFAVAGGAGGFAQVSMNIRPTSDRQSEGVSSVALQSGDLRVTLTWNTTADIDLHMVEPWDGISSQSRVYYGNPEGRTLTMDREDNTDGADGYGPENMYLPHDKQTEGNGTYSIFLHYYQAWPAYSPSGRTTCLVRVKTRNETRIFERVLEASGTLAMVTEIAYTSSGTAIITEKPASSATPWTPPGPGQSGSRRKQTLSPPR
ncbi:MAG: hypothetical protein WA705_07100 [Candidatus Ozemobacteraceae bacterium]